MKLEDALDNINAVVLTCVALSLRLAPQGNPQGEEKRWERDRLAKEPLSS